MSEGIKKPKIFMMDLWATVPYYTAYLSRALLLQGVDVTVGSITYYLDVDCFTGRGIKTDPGLIDVVGRFQLPAYLRRALKLVESVVNHCALTLRFLRAKPDIIHVQYLPMLRLPLPLDLWFVRFFHKRGVGVVLTVHDLMPHDTAEAYKQVFHRLYSMVDKLICHSDHIKARLNLEFAVSEEKIAVIPHGPFFYDLVETNAAETLHRFDVEQNKLLILWQGILFPYKGVDLLLEAWKVVEAESDSAVLVIAGTGAPELLEQIRAQVIRLGLQRVKLHFRFISTAELVTLYRAADIVVYPYRAITTSGALATGLALGKTIVASDLPVFRELLIDRESALLVNPQEPVPLAAALSELITDSALRDKLAERVREMNFGDKSWDTIATQTVAVYEELTTLSLR